MLAVSIVCCLSACLVRLTSATPHARKGHAPTGHEWQPPGPNDVRSPCPGINTAANHGFIPRSGRNISVLTVAQGLLEGFNVGLDFGTLVGQTATLSNPDPTAGVFNMDQLREHNFPLEHDCSLSREDYYQGNDLSFNQTVFNQVLRYYHGMQRTTYQQAARAMWHRVHYQTKLNPTKEIYGPRQLALGLVESSLYMSLMGNPLTGDAPIKYVKSFFEQERLPYELGWTKPTVEINFATLAAMAAQVLAADLQDAVPDALDLDLTIGLIRDAFSLSGSVEGVLLNATCAKAGTC